MHPRFLHHYSKKYCFSPKTYTEESRNYRMACEFLQGSGIGQLLPPFRNSILDGRVFMRKHFNLVLSHSGNLTARDLNFYSFLGKTESPEFYKPYLMGEQLFPRPSELLMRQHLFMKNPWDDVHQPAVQPTEFRLHILEVGQVLNLQEKWMSQIDTCCTEYFIPKKWRSPIMFPEKNNSYQALGHLSSVIESSLVLFRNPEELPRLLVSVGFAAVMIMQVWSNILGSILLTKRCTTIPTCQSMTSMDFRCGLFFASRSAVC